MKIKIKIVAYQWGRGGRGYKGVEKLLKKPKVQLQLLHVFVEKYSDTVGFFVPYRCCRS